MNSAIICIIDDDETYQFYMKKIIETLKAAKQVLSFGDGEEAIEYLSQNVSNISILPHVIFLDINMPIMDGWQFIDEYVLLKPRIGRKIVIYMVSSSNNQEDLDHAKAISEISDYLIKPVTPDQLKKIVAALQLNGSYEEPNG